MPLEKFVFVPLCNLNDAVFSLSNETRVRRSHGEIGSLWTCKLRCWTGIEFRWGSSESGAVGLSRTGTFSRKVGGSVISSHTPRAVDRTECLSATDVIVPRGCGQHLQRYTPPAARTPILLHQ